MATLQNTKWTVSHETSGSRGQLVLNGNTTGTYNVGPSQSPVIWSEQWNGNYCALWVIFKDETSQGITRIWGVVINGAVANQGSGTGMSALGNATPADLSNTTFQNDYLTFTQQ